MVASTQPIFLATNMLVVFADNLLHHLLLTAIIRAIFCQQPITPILSLTNMDTEEEHQAIANIWVAFAVNLLTKTRTIKTLT